MLLVALTTLSSVVLSFTAAISTRVVSAKVETSAVITTVPKAELPTDAAKSRALEAYGKLPLNFEPNLGQADERVKFLSRGKGYTLFLTATEAVLTLRAAKPALENTSAQKRSLKSAVVRMQLLGSRSNPQIEGEEAFEGRVNYLTGNDQSKWQRDVPTYREVRYFEVWPGIDMVWHGKQSELEYDFILKPGADVSRVRLKFAGADKLRIDPAGNLLAQTRAGEVVQHAPVIYQETDRGRETISGNYRLNRNREITFAVGPYDKTKPLVIDPVLIYSTYLGGDREDEAQGISVDSNGQAFITGPAFFPSSFPANNGIAVDDFGRTSIFITKLRADGTGAIYSTIVGSDEGGGEGVTPKAIAVTADGKACVTGVVDNFFNDNLFPITPNAFQDNGVNCVGACNGRDNRLFDAFVTVLNAQGNALFYSTFYGGAAFLEFTDRGKEIGEGIAVDSSNRVYITGSTSSNDLPTKNAFQNNRQSSGEGKDAFVAVFDPAQVNGRDTLLYASYLGGEGDDIGRGIAVDSARNAYVGGSTASFELRTKSPAGQSLPPLQQNFQGGGFDGFLAKIDTESEGNASLTYLTYFGGNINDRVESVAVDNLQRAYITGASNSSSGSFPLRNEFDATQTNGEAFVAKLNADGTALFYCSFLGGNNLNTSQDGEEGLGIAIDSGGNAYVTGRTTSGASFPAGVVAPPFPANLQGTAFIAKIEASVSSSTKPKLLYSTTFGGGRASGESIAVDSKGNVYLAGSSGGDLPTTIGAFQSQFNGGETDGFVAKIATTFNDTIGVYRPSINQFQLRNSNTAGPADKLIAFGSAGDLPVTGDWDGNGIDDVGIFRPSTGQFQLRIPGLRPLVSIVTVNFGQSGDIPVAGDWNGDGIDTPGVFRPAVGAWLLTNGPNINNTTPPIDLSFSFGQIGDIPLAGDWNGDGLDTPGVFRPAGALFILSNSFLGTTDITPFVFGLAKSLALAGDWDGDGVSTVGVFNPTTGVMSLNNTNTSGNGVGDLVFNFGQNGDLPLGGDWDGKP